MSIWKNIGNLVLDTVSTLPVIGLIKYGKEIKLLFKTQKGEYIAAKSISKAGKTIEASQLINITNKLKTSVESLNDFIKKVYSRTNGILEVEAAGLGKVSIDEKLILEDADNICKNRYYSWLEGKLAENSSETEIKNASKDVVLATEKNYILFNKTHKGSAPVPKGTGPNGGRLQSHHGLQQEWAKENLAQYGYDGKLAPTITIATGKGLPHTIISNAQNARRNARVANGNGKWNSTLQEELKYIIEDFTNSGFSNDTINGVLEQQYKMLDELNVPYERIMMK